MDSQRTYSGQPWLEVKLLQSDCDDGNVADCVRGGMWNPVEMSYIFKSTLKRRAWEVTTGSAPSVRISLVVLKET